MHREEEPSNLVALVERSIRLFQNKPLFGTKNRQGDYEWVTYGDVGARIDRVRAGLAQSGVGRNDAVGIIAGNRTEWAVAAFAAFGLGALFVPMYESERSETWRYIIADSGLSVLFVASNAVRKRVEDIAGDIPTLKSVVVIDGDGGDSMAALESAGEKSPVPSLHPDESEIAVLIYTSGTTGHPKGVLLSHGNLTSNSHAGRKMYPEIAAEGGVSLSILPWAHSYGQTAELYTIIYLGGSIGFVGSVDTFAEDIRKVRPTWLIAVPRVFNKIYNDVWRTVTARGGVARLVFTAGLKAAEKKRLHASRGESAIAAETIFALCDRIVFRKIRDQLGGRLLGAMTASATMNPDIARFFFDIGIPLYDCYGLTETSPAVTMNASFDYRLGTVGKTIDGVSLVIDTSVTASDDESGEIIVYGPNVMQGYHNKPEETRRVMTDDGGFRTGDCGVIDRDGFLSITGRIKEQYKLENGKYVFPGNLEEDINCVSSVESAMIYGEGRPFNIVLVVPDEEAVRRYAVENDLPTERSAMYENDAVQAMIYDEIVDHLRERYASYEIPRKMLIVEEPFTRENGMLTQTLKLKRRVVIEKYLERIDALYKT